jgi:hypothetical protein
VIRTTRGGGRWPPHPQSRPGQTGYNPTNQQTNAIALQRNDTHHSWTTTGTSGRVVSSAPSYKARSLLLLYLDVQPRNLLYKLMAARMEGDGLSASMSLSSSSKHLHQPLQRDHMKASTLRTRKRFARRQQMKAVTVIERSRRHN